MGYNGIAGREKFQPWFFDTLANAGYRYDASIFPGARIHGGMKSARMIPHKLPGGIVELPVSVVPEFGRRLCFFGAGYLRLFPYPVIRSMASGVLAEGRPVNFYLHPREIDPEQPRLPMNFVRRFKSYVSLKGTENKVRHLMDDFDWMTFGDYIKGQPSLAENL